MKSRSQVLLSIVMLLCIMVFGLGGIPTETAAQDATPSGTPEHAAPRFGIAPADPAYGGFFEDVVVESGQTITLEAAILNLGEESVQLRAFNTNALSGVNGGFVAGKSDDPLTAPATWVDFPEFEADVAAQSQTNISFTVSVPEGTPAGQYITALVVETVGTYALPGNDMFDQRPRFAISVGVLVPGEIVHSFELGQPFWDRGYLAIPVQNTGNYLVRPAGKLVVANTEGDEILTTPIQMGSVYAGLPSAVYVDLPDQLQPGDYTVNMSLTDEASGFATSLDGATFTIEEPEDPTGIFLGESTVEPNAEEIVFANVSVTLDNGGGHIPAANVTLEVSRDGNVVEEYPLATNQVLVSGENVLTDRYIPSDPWESGTYTFRIIVYAVDPNGGQQTELLNEPLDVELVVP